MLSQFNFAPKFGVKERKKEVVFNLKGKRCGNDALWKSEGRLDKRFFHSAWKKGRNGENFLKVLELLEVVQFKVSHIAKAAPSVFPHSHTTTTIYTFIVSSNILRRKNVNQDYGDDARS